MGGSPLRASSTAVLLLDLAGRRATGRLAFGDRTARLSAGDLIEISPPSEVERDAPKRALLIERLAAALRTADERSEAAPVLEPALRSGSDSGLPLAPLVLDAVASLVSPGDLEWLATQLDHRITLRESPVASVARAWAGIDLAFARPAVSTVLAKRPDAGPRLYALLRTGVARLEGPGGRTQTSSPAKTGTLPPPAPRFSIVPSDPPAPAPPNLLSQLSVRPPRLRLDPGHAHDAGEPIVPTVLPALRLHPIHLDDPIDAIEQRIAALEASGAAGPERARLFVSLADTWLQRLGSVERACRALREACAADPSDARTLQQTALYCHMLGESELALRYVDAAVQASGISIERASAQRLRATIVAAQGARELHIEALCEAAADDPGSPEPHEHVCALLAATQPAGANAHARLAATGFSESDPARALALLDHAFALMPGDLPTAYEYASLLDAQGSRNAAVAVLARAAELQTDPDARRKLRLSAAQRAEAAGRADRAAELLEDALDAEPHFDLLYAPLDEDLAAADFPEHRAVVLEDIATACPEEDRAMWLARAASALIAIEGQRESALWIAFEGALVHGARAESLELLRAHAQSPGELVMLVYALRAAASALLAQGQSSVPLLREMAALAVDRIDNPELGLAALAQLERLGAPAERADAALRTRAAQRAGEREQALRTAEIAMHEATVPRAQAALAVARLMPDLPEAWPRRIELLHAALDAGAPRNEVVDALETLYGLTRDAAGLAAFLDDQLEATESKTERVRLLMRLASVHTVREDPHAVAASCELLLALDPGHRMAIARLYRAARRLGVPALFARALEHRVRIASAPTLRARCLSRLARAYELAGAKQEAAERAIDALRLDPGAADAALVLLATYREVAPDQALAALRAVPAALSSSARALHALFVTAQAAGDEQAQRSALDQWTRVLPTDRQAHVLRLTHALHGDSGPVLHEAAQAALSACDADETRELSDALQHVIDRLEAGKHAGLAARLCLRLAEEQGRKDAPLVQRAARLAPRIAPELRTRALELWAAYEPEPQRPEIWLELAAHHATHADPLGELRALLRVLEVDVSHPHALSRLHALFLAAGDTGRALSVATLRLETQDDAQARRASLIELATLAGKHARDLPRAELYVRRMVAESQGELPAVREALGVLLALGEPRWALTRARAIADGCPDELRGRIYHACASTAEVVIGDAELALELAAHGALSAKGYAPLLLMMERLSLAARDTQTAMRTYDGLIASAIGPHGRRALVYRAGRWLERAGQLEQALVRYVDAFELEPSAGAAFLALQRVAQETGQLERVLLCFERLADLVTHESTRVDLVGRAVELCLGPLHDPKRAIDLLRKALKTRDHTDLSLLLERAARELQGLDGEQGRLAFSQLVEDLEQRAEQLWEGPDKVRCLLRIASLAARELDDPVGGLARAEEAVSLVEREQLGTDLLAEALSAREQIEAIALATRSIPAPTANVEAAPSLAPEPEDITHPTPLASTAREPISARPEQASPTAPPARGAASAPERSVTPAPSSQSTRPPQGHASGPPVDRAAAREQLLELIDRDPFRADAIRKLHALSAQEPGSVEHHVATALLSVLDRAVAPPPERGFHSGLLRPDAAHKARADELPTPARKLVARIWDAARTVPRFRLTAMGMGLTDRDRLTQHSSTVVAEAYAQAARILDASDVPVFATASDESSAVARVVAAHPPLLLVHVDRALACAAESGRSALLWTFGRALTLAQPDQVFAAALEPHDAKELLGAAALAFAPAVAIDPITASVKELAAALWQNVPAREQRDLTATLKEHADLITFDALELRAEVVGARAGLLASGDIHGALSNMLAHDRKLAGLAVHDNASFAEACRRSPAFAATVRCAISPELRAALALARPAR